MRELTSHKVNGLNEALTIEVLDEPGHGGACHHYEIRLPGWTREPGGNSKGIWNIEFQNGPIAEAGLNGISNEALLAIVEDQGTSEK